MQLRKIFLDPGKVTYHHRKRDSRKVVIFLSALEGGDLDDRGLLSLFSDQKVGGVRLLWSRKMVNACLWQARCDSSGFEEGINDC